MVTSTNQQGAERLVEIERTAFRLRSVLSEWAEDPLIDARLRQLRIEADGIRRVLELE